MTKLPHGRLRIVVFATSTRGALCEDALRNPAAATNNATPATTPALLVVLCVSIRHRAAYFFHVPMTSASTRSCLAVAHCA